MVWPEIISILETELATFSDPPERLISLRDWTQYESRDAAIEALKFDESTHWRTVNAACLEFAEDRKWPRVSREELFWIYGRLSAARDLVRFFLTCKRSERWVVPASETDVPDRSVLEVLLVRYWVSQGRAAFLGSIVFDQTEPFGLLADLPRPDYD